MANTTEMELKMVKNEYNIPAEQLGYYKNEIMELLPKYRYKSDRHYAPTDKGVNALLEVYNKEKGWMYPYFMSHPNYIGNGKIAFSSDYHRKVNKSGVRQFLNWMSTEITKYYIKKYEVKFNNMTFREASKAADRINDILIYMSRINNIQLGSGNASCRVNGLTHSEMAEEQKRLNEILYAFGDCAYMGNNHYINTEKYKECLEINGFLSYVKENPHMMTTADEVEKLNKYVKHLDINIVAGQKFSRIIGKICRKYKLDKVDEYSQKFAKLGDDINELDIKRHTVISINPVDYLTMSFGNSWSSCHTIDKMNDRGCANTYHGQYSGGTLSYMLDGASIVFYTVDKRYDGTDFEFQPKINRCMFHLGEDKLIQGRVYPQANDGDQTIYDEIRAIMQKVVSELFGTNNLWFIKKGTSACYDVTESTGAHYRDYTNFDSCNVSWIKPTDGKAKNMKRILIGHKGICPTCGESHSSSNAIICNECFSNIKRCPHCGRVINEDDHIEIDGQVYCSNCAKWCDFHKRYEIDTTMCGIFTNATMHRYSRRDVRISSRWTGLYVCEEAVRSNPTRYRRCAETMRLFDTTEWNDGIIVYNGYDNSEYYYSNKEFAEYRGYKQAYNGKYYHKDEMCYDRHTGVKAYIPACEWNSELGCWNGIADEVRQHNEMLAQRAERRAAREARRNAENAA